MPAGRCYSVRFMSGRGGNREEIFVVPDGRRAVVKSVALLAWPGATSAFVWVHGIPVYYWVPPGPNLMKFDAVRWTAYEREQVKVTCVGTDWSYAIDGFLYEDLDGEPDDGDNVINPVSHITPLPSEGGRS